MKIHTRKRAIFMRSVDRRNAVSAQEPKKFALSSQRKLSVLLVVGIIILSAKDCDMKPMGPGGGDGDQKPVVAEPLSLARTTVVVAGRALANNDRFGGSVANAGDLDGDGGTVLAVGAWGTDLYKGAIYLLSYDAMGSLDSTKKIASGVDETNGSPTTSNDNAPILAGIEYFGFSIANAGDLDGGGGTVLAVGAASDDTGGLRRGAIYLLSFDETGALQNTTKIAHGSDTNAPRLANEDFFGSGIANAGDLDGGGGTVLAVGAPGDDTGGQGRGAMYMLSFNASGNLTRTTKISSETYGGPKLTDEGSFGNSIANVGDLDGGGGTVLAVGAAGDDTGGSNRGGIYLLSFNPAGALQSTKKIASGVDETNEGDTPETTLASSLSYNDAFGWSIANVGDLNDDGHTVLAVGAESDNTGGPDRGAMYMLFFNTAGSLTTTTKVTHGTTKGPVLGDNHRFGNIANVGNLDGTGGRVLAVGGGGNLVSPTNKTGTLHLLYYSSSKK